jgi:hypothetical protein
MGAGLVQYISSAAVAAFACQDGLVKRNRQSWAVLSLDQFSVASDTEDNTEFCLILVCEISRKHRRRTHRLEDGHVAVALSEDPQSRKATTTLAIVGFYKETLCLLISHLHETHTYIPPLHKPNQSFDHVIIKMSVLYEMR